MVSPCKNGGTCLEEKDDFRCICTREWKGKDCSESKACDDVDNLFALNDKILTYLSFLIEVYNLQIVVQNNAVISS